MCTTYTPVALKLHSRGLARLHTPTWCGEELYDWAKRYYRGRAEPREMFQKTIENGFLCQLGLWLFHDYIHIEHWLDTQDVDGLLEYLEDYVAMLTAGGLAEVDPEIRRARRVLERAQAISVDNEGQFYRRRSQIRWLVQRCLEQLKERNRDLIEKLAPIYGANYADRVFHDRELCAYLANLIIELGIDGTVDDESPTQWCGRRKIPEWAKEALRARERGKCAQCRADLVFELDDEIHFDHIVPLSRGGCNDLVNLQVLCARCNLKKGTADWPTKTSIPGYIGRRLGAGAA